MSRSVEEKRRAFRDLHARGCFVLPNPWDVGSARMLAHLGFSALASTSSGFSWSLGRPDYGLRCSDVVAHLRLLGPDLQTSSELTTLSRDLARLIQPDARVS